MVKNSNPTMIQKGFGGHMRFTFGAAANGLVRPRPTVAIVADPLSAEKDYRAEMQAAQSS
jgi:hypothetical protein